MKLTMALTSTTPKMTPASARFLRFETLHEVGLKQDHDLMDRQVVAGRNHTTSMDWLSS